MSNLPPKPDFDSHDRDKYPRDDRHYSRSYPPPPPRERSYRDHADSYVPRPRPTSNGDSYVATDSYVASTYDRRHDDRPRPHEGSHHHSSRQSWEHDSRPYSREWRDGYDRREPPTRRRELDWRRRDDSPDRRRDWETRRDYPPRERSRDYPRDYRRDRDYDNRLRDEERHYQQDSGNRRRSSRPSVSPSRRPDYESRRRSSLQRRSASPSSRRPRLSRSPPPSRTNEKSRPLTPRVKAAPSTHSVSTSPRPNVPDRYRPKRYEDRRSHSPRRGSSRERRSRSPVRHGREDYKPKTELLDPKLSSSNSKPKSPRAKSRSPPVVKVELPQDDLPEEPPKEPLRDKGKAREPADTGADSEVKTREPPSPPRKPKALTVSSSLQPIEATAPAHSSRLRRSPPTAPRHHAGLENSGSSSPALSAIPPKAERGKRDSAAGTPVEKAAGATEDNIAPPKYEPIIQLPLIPVYSPKESVSHTIDAEIKELQVHRARMAAEYSDIYKAARRAVHDLEMSNAELNVARLRREIADAQMEKARMGILGMDYEGVFSDL